MLQALAGLAQDGFSPEQLDCCSTHSHTDHCEAAVSFKEKRK